MLFGSGVAVYNNCISTNRHTLVLCHIDRTELTTNPRRRHHHRQQCLPWKEMFVCITRPLFTTTGQIIVSLIFIIYTICACYGALQMRDGMKLGQLLSDDSYANHYFGTLDKEFELYTLVQFIITEPIPYWRDDYMKRIGNLVKQVKELEGEKDFFVLTKKDLIKI